MHTHTRAHMHAHTNTAITPYVSLHLRRGDFVWAHAKTQSTEEHVVDVLKRFAEVLVVSVVLVVVVAVVMVMAVCGGVGGGVWLW